MDFSRRASVHAAAREAKQRQRGGEVSGDQRGRPAEWEPTVDDQEHVGGEATAAVLQQSNDSWIFSPRIVILGRRLVPVAKASCAYCRSLMLSIPFGLRTPQPTSPFHCISFDCAEERRTANWTTAAQASDHVSNSSGERCCRRAERNVEKYNSSRSRLD